MRGWNIMGENTEMWWSCWICGNTESMWRIIRLRWLKRMRIEPWNSWRGCWNLWGNHGIWGKADCMISWQNRAQITDSRRKYLRECVTGC